MADSKAPDTTAAQDKSPLAQGVPLEVQIVGVQERQNLSRGLKQRHVQMIAIAGAIVRAVPSSRRRSVDA